jgi:cytochrome b subunit of formate dehydrogenase
VAQSVGQFRKGQQVIFWITFCLFEVLFCVIYGLVLYWLQDPMPVGLWDSSGIGKQMDYWKV